MSPVRKVKLGPYNTYYPTIKSDMDKANLNRHAHNLWSEAIVFGANTRVMKNKNKGDTTQGGNNNNSDDNDDDNTTSTTAKMSPDEYSSGETEGVNRMEIETKNSTHSKKRQRDDEEIGGENGENGEDDTTAIHVRHQQQQEDISLMPPEEFFYEPFLLDKNGSGSTDGDTKNVPGENRCPFNLPQPYASAHPLQRQRVLDLKNLIDTADINEIQRNAVHSFVHEAFQKWLEDTKRLQHIKNVANYQCK